LVKKRNDRRDKRKAEAAERRRAYESKTPVEIVREMEDRGIKSGREYKRMMRHVGHGIGNRSLSRIREEDRRKARERERKRAENAAITRDVFHPQLSP